MRIHVCVRMWWVILTEEQVINAEWLLISPCLHCVYELHMDCIYWLQPGMRPRQYIVTERPKSCWHLTFHPINMIKLRVHHRNIAQEGIVCCAVMQPVSDAAGRFMGFISMDADWSQKKLFLDLSLSVFYVFTERHQRPVSVGPCV